MVPLSWYLLLSAVLFACGVAGFLVKRNIITIFMSIELMLNGSIFRSSRWPPIWAS
jgi:NADH-quinone oxidoreductase subunit K